jgi:hypothetical protein
MILGWKCSFDAMEDSGGWKHGYCLVYSTDPDEAMQIVTQFMEKCVGDREHIVRASPGGGQHKDFMRDIVFYEGRCRFAVGPKKGGAIYPECNVRYLPLPPGVGF